MKKIALTLLALALIMALSLAAAAETGTMFVRKDCKVYQKPDRHSHVTLKLKAGHELIVTRYKDGYFECRYGWIQEKYLVEKLTPETCSHKYGSWTVTKKATCTAKGTRERVCKLCGKVDTESIKKKGHEWGKWKITKAATCTKQGSRTRTCKVCNATEKESYYADHDYGSWKVLRQATCSDVGQRTHTCKNCGREETKAIPTLPHDFEWNVLMEATDHSSGTRAQVCKVCGHAEKAQSYDPEGTLRRGDRSTEVYQLQQQLIEQGYLNVGGADGMFGGGTERALMKFQTEQGLNPDGVAWPQTLKRLGHDFGPWETVKSMTRTTPGERVRVCPDCGYEQHETVEMGDIIERGARGEHIRAIQQILTQLGYQPGGVDGVYGQKLDTAFTAFDEANNMVFEKGKVRPADVDALVSAWLAASATPPTECGMATPVNLALSVTPTFDAVADSEVTTYHWSLTNLGAQKCMFTALLLTYGDADFSGNDLVMNIDGEELKPNAGNSVTGNFKVAKGWGDGNVNFAALAVTDKDGMKWLSNTVTFEAEVSGEPKTVSPIPVDIYVNSLPDGKYFASFDRGDVASVASGIYMNAVHIYSADEYAAADIESLAEGDSVVVEGEIIAVKSVAFEDDAVLVNGGMDETDGVTFTLPEGGRNYKVLRYDDLTTYTDHGTTTLPVDASAKFVDGWNIESEPVTTAYDGLMDALMASEFDVFSPMNTTITFENGRVVEINRQYVP